MSDIKNAKRIVVTGGAGFLGGPVVEELVRRGADRESIHIPRSETEDLRVFNACMNILEDTDILIHMAARVGGIGFNQRNPGALFYDNASMGINLIEAARRLDVKKVVVIGTTCSYPKFCPIPFNEDNLWDGYPEETNAPYGIAKKSLAVMLAAYAEQYGMNGIYLLPVNLYGPRDNFDLEDSHVIPALIRKFITAKEMSYDSVELWGDGSPTREFLFVRDAARGIAIASDIHNSVEPINLGSSEEISIKNLADIIRKKIGFKGEIVWNTDHPNGQPRRKLDTNRAKEAFQFQSEIGLDEGIEATIDWWVQNKGKSGL